MGKGRLGDVSGENLRDLFSEEFLRGFDQKILAGGVIRQKPSLLIQGKHKIGEGVEDGPKGLFALAEFFLDAPCLGDVPPDDHKAFSGSVGVEERHLVDVKNPWFTLKNGDYLFGSAGLTLFPGPFVGFYAAFEGLPVDGVRQGSQFHVGFAPVIHAFQMEECEIGLIGQHPPPLPILEADDIGGGVNQAGKPFPFLVEGPPGLVDPRGIHKNSQSS